MASTLILDSVKFAGAIVDNSNIKSAAAIDPDKMGHYYNPVCNFDLPIGSTPAAREEIVHICASAGTIESFVCGLNETGTTTDIDFDLKVNGTSVLSAAVNVTNSDADRVLKSGTISNPTVAIGDVISVSLATTTTTGAQGPFAQVRVKETSAP